MQKKDLPDFAIKWSKKLEVSPRTILQLKGGINAKVYRCGTKSRYFVLKGYGNDLQYSQERFIAELKFLRYSESIAPQFTPRLLYSDFESLSIVLEYIDGMAFSVAKKPTKNEILDAVNFYRIINQKKNDSEAVTMPSAIDGFLKITDHLDNINSRLGGMSVDHLPDELKSNAKIIILNMHEKLEKISKEVLNLISKNIIENEWKSENRYVSPGDFGFHNAIRTKQGIKFIDFEFSGLDDPSKTIIDFDLQPRVPIFSKALILINGIHESDKEKVKIRSLALKPILKLKWGCIILSLLSPQRWQHFEAQHPEQISVEIIKNKLFHGLKYLL